MLDTLKNKINREKKKHIKVIRKKLNSYILLNNKKEAFNTFILLQKSVDKYSQKRVIHKNKAAKIKSIWNKKINQLV